MRATEATEILTGILILFATLQGNYTDADSTGTIVNLLSFLIEQMGMPSSPPPLLMSSQMRQSLSGLSVPTTTQCPYPGRGRAGIPLLTKRRDSR